MVTTTKTETEYLPKALCFPELFDQSTLIREQRFGSVRICHSPFLFDGGLVVRRKGGHTGEEHSVFLGNPIISNCCFNPTFTDSISWQPFISSFFFPFPEFFQSFDLEYLQPMSGFSWSQLSRISTQVSAAFNSTRFSEPKWLQNSEYC